MNPKKQSKIAAASGFTSIELLVVVVIISILAALVLVVIGQSKVNALQTQCASNLRQLALADTLFTDDNGFNAPFNSPNTEGYDPNIPDTLWMGGMSNYLMTPSIRTCPITRTLVQPPAQPAPGTADLVWYCGYSQPLMTGSYGFNYWLFSFSSPDAMLNPNLQSDVFPSPSSVLRPTQTPVFFDSIWDIAAPLETDVPAADLYTGYSPNSPNGPSATGAGMEVCTILRHGGKLPRSPYPFSGPPQTLFGCINIGMADGHEQLVRLSDLWSYYWHMNWQTPSYASLIDPPLSPQ